MFFIKNIINAIIVLAYILLIGSMIINSENFIFKEEYLLIINIVLLSIGLYNFINKNNNNK